MGCSKYAKNLAKFLSERTNYWGGQVELAKLSDLPTSTLSRIIKGQVEPDLESLIKLSAGLGLLPSDIINIAAGITSDQPSSLLTVEQAKLLRLFDGCNAPDKTIVIEAATSGFERNKNTSSSGARKARL